MELELELELSGHIKRTKEAKVQGSEFKVQVVTNDTSSLYQSTTGTPYCETHHVPPIYFLYSISTGDQDRSL